MYTSSKRWPSGGVLYTPCDRTVRESLTVGGNRRDRGGKDVFRSTPTAAAAAAAAAAVQPAESSAPAAMEADCYFAACYVPKRLDLD